jgi:transposase
LSSTAPRGSDPIRAATSLTQGGTVGVTASDNRLFVEAVLYRYRAGIPWRDLPERFGDWKNVHRRFSRWAETGVWEKVFQHLAADADNEYAMIDSTIVRAHQHSAGAQKKMGRTRRSDGRVAD